VLLLVVGGDDDGDAQRPRPDNREPRARQQG
jgi:hypothetical protein